MKKLMFVLLAAFVGAASAESIEVYKSKTCGCCQAWVDIMKSKGHEVTVHHPFNLQKTKADLGVPKVLGSCHTAVINGYVFEGHIPERDIIKFLANPPEGKIGLAAPGMPALSPGMAPEGAEYKNFRVISFDKDGKMSLYSQY